ncbi:hypothetical protein B0T19DRAFT_397512 [Cercophora scortea]|uniref:Rhodopsin domain-containing protein n=1 Tax=Cercophora scortea TaxID=314031 RepID=A0AAE0IVF5_9PEZI|nr:hypothetical protein B0T19DRAFT_397512 [Cercophora scortea]
MSAAAADTGSGPPAGGGIFITDDNLNPVVQIITWVLLACTSLMICFRLLTRYFLTKRRFFGGWDDILLIVSYILAVGEMVAWILPQSTIFGRSLNLISRDELAAGLKAMYAGDILFILSLGLAKLSVCACYLNLVPANDTFHRQWSYLTAGVVVLWTMSFSLAAAFRCGIRPWWDYAAYDETAGIMCMDQTAFLQSISITNILTDFGLVVIPISLLAPLSLPFRTRAGAILIFSARALVIIPCAFQLAYIPRLADMTLDSATNWTLNGFPYFVATQAVEFAGIAAACIIYLSPFLQSLGSGAMTARESLVSFTPKKRKQSAQAVHLGSLGSGSR